MAIVHGAHGIIYFCHEFKPEQIEAGLLKYPEIVEAVKGVNAEVAQFAPVINSPTINDAVDVTVPGAEDPVAVLRKRSGEDTFLFAVSKSDKPLRATFNVHGSPAEMVEVVGENRGIRAAAGRFDDDFTPYGVHIYRLSR